MPKGNLSARSQMLMLMMVAVVTAGLLPFLHGPVVSSGRAVQSDNRIQSPIGWLPALRLSPTRINRTCANLRRDGYRTLKEL